jgi:hypothetical protein
LEKYNVNLPPWILPSSVILRRRGVLRRSSFTRF